MDRKILPVKPPSEKLADRQQESSDPHSPLSPQPQQRSPTRRSIEDILSKSSRPSEKLADAEGQPPDPATLPKPRPQQRQHQGRDLSPPQEGQQEGQQENAESVFDQAPSPTQPDAAQRSPPVKASQRASSPLGEPSDLKKARRTFSPIPKAPMTGLEAQWAKLCREVQVLKAKVKDDEALIAEQAMEMADLRDSNELQQMRLMSSALENGVLEDALAKAGVALLDAKNEDLRQDETHAPRSIPWKNAEDAIDREQAEDSPIKETSTNNLDLIALLQSKINRLQLAAEEAGDTTAKVTRLEAENARLQADNAVWEEQFHILEKWQEDLALGRIAAISGSTTSPSSSWIAGSAGADDADDAGDAGDAADAGAGAGAGAGVGDAAGDVARAGDAGSDAGFEQLDSAMFANGSFASPLETDTPAEGKTVGSASASARMTGNAVPLSASVTGLPSRAQSAFDHRPKSQILRDSIQKNRRKYTSHRTSVLGMATREMSTDGALYESKTTQTDDSTSCPAMAIVSTRTLFSVPPTISSFTERDHTPNSASAASTPAAEIAPTTLPSSATAATPSPPKSLSPSPWAAITALLSRSNRTSPSSAPSSPVTSILWTAPPSASKGTQTTPPASPQPLIIPSASRGTQTTPPVSPLSPVIPSVSTATQTTPPASPLPFIVSSASTGTQTTPPASPLIESTPSAPATPTESETSDSSTITITLPTLPAFPQAEEKQSFIAHLLLLLSAFLLLLYAECLAVERQAWRQANHEVRSLTAGWRGLEWWSGGMGEWLAWEGEMWSGVDRRLPG